jgi:hypothetical protein
MGAGTVIESRPRDTLTFLKTFASSPSMRMNCCVFEGRYRRRDSLKVQVFTLLTAARSGDQVHLNPLRGQLIPSASKPPPDAMDAE